MYAAVAVLYLLGVGLATSPLSPAAPRANGTAPPDPRGEVRAAVLARMQQCFRKNRAVPAWYALPAAWRRPPAAANRTQFWASRTSAPPAARMDEYARSRFAQLNDTAGAPGDAEVVGAGAVPVLKDAERLPFCAMAGYPHALIKDVARALDRPTSEPLTPESYWARELQVYLDATLTAGAAVETYFDFFRQRIIESEPPRRVLFVDCALNSYPGALSAQLLLGLTEAWNGTVRVDTPFPAAFMYDDWKGDAADLPYARTIPAARRSSPPADFPARHDYDLVVYGSVTQCSWNVRLWKLPAYRVWLFADGPVTRADVARLSSAGLVFSLT